MRRIVLRLAVCLGYMVVSCALACMAAPDQRNNVSQANDFAGKVITIDRLAGEIVANEGLLADEPFVKLASEGADNIGACIRFLVERGHTPQQRMIAILSMHKLGVHEYVVFLRELADLFDKGLVSRNELGVAVVPTYAFSTVLIEDYTQSDVQSILREIAARGGIRPATKSAIESIVSGKALEDLQSFRRDCCSGPAKEQ